MDRRRFRPILMFASLVLMTGAVYWPIHRFGFVDFDDDLYVFNNPGVHTGLSASALHDAFVSFALGNYHPLVWLSYHADWMMFALNPGPMHVENVLLHLIGGLLLWRWLFVITGQLNRSFAVAALFLCHPMHVESVAWISERKDMLSTIWEIAALLAYVRFCRADRRSSRWFMYGGMVVFFALSLLSKAMGVTLPAVLLLLDFWPLRRWPTRSWLLLIAEKLPLFAMSLTAALVGARAQIADGAATTLSGLGLLDRIDNALICYVIYIAKLVIPINLTIMYTHPGSWPVSAAVAAGGLLALVTMVFYRLRVGQPYLMVGWLWFLGALLPVIGIMQIGAQSMADRYSYFPSIGLFVAAVWAVARFEIAWLNKALLLAAIVGFGIVAHRQVGYWQDSQSLFTHAVQVSDDTPVSHVILGQVALDHQDYQRAIVEYQRAEDIVPNPRGYAGLGDAWVMINRPQAIGFYQTALAMVPNSAEYRVKLAEALRQEGAVDEARRQTLRALAINPDYLPARQEMAKITNQPPR